MCSSDLSTSPVGFPNIKITLEYLDHWKSLFTILYFKLVTKSTIYLQLKLHLIAIYMDRQYNTLLMNSFISLFKPAILFLCLN